MKGLNDMVINTGMLVRIKEKIPSPLGGALGIVREKTEDLWGEKYYCIVEVLKSATHNQITLKNGIKINGVNLLSTDLVPVHCELEEYDNFTTKLLNQHVNDEKNVWEARIASDGEDKDIAEIRLFVNGRLERTEYVSRYVNDEYDSFTACIEACKKMFGVKDIEKKSEEIPMPKYYTGKVICTRNSKFFTKGKMYKVENGTICSDEDDKFDRFESLEQLNDYSVLGSPNFIEFVE